MTRTQLIARLSWAIRLSQLHRLFFWCYDRLRFYTVDWRKTASLERQGEKTKSRLAILAIFQPKGVSDFVKREVDFLRSLGYDVAVSVPHALSDSDRAFFDARCRFRVSRPNLARDFGSYRDAVLQIGFDRISEYERVLLVNDSIYFPIGPTEQFVKEFQEATSRADVVGLTENAESIRHVASFFVDVSTTVFCSTASRRYWESYKLYNSRFYAIRQGECGLSKVLYRQASSIELLYSKERIVEDAYENFGGRIDFKTFFHLLSDPFFGGVKGSLIAPTTRHSLETRVLEFAEAIRRVLEASSVPHSFGLHLIRLYGAPLLKRDVYYHEIFDLSQVRMALEPVVEPEVLSAVIGELRRKGAARNQSAWQELMIRLGIR